ncbi:MAG: hypothetical protein Q4G11_03815 [Gallicola sp.]|nr:hypothetical protein [Gallicola sp.]
MTNYFSGFIYDDGLKKKYFQDMKPYTEEKYDIVFISTIGEYFDLQVFAEGFKNIKSVCIEKAGTTSDGEYFFLISPKIGETMETEEDYEKYEVGFSIGSDLRDYHNTAPVLKMSPWPKEYETKINHIFHEYGIQKYRGAEDYIILDVLNQTKHLLKDRENIQHILYKDLETITVGKNGKYNPLKDAYLSLSDPYYVFHNINQTGIKSGAYGAGLIDGYFKGDTPNLFFKYLAMYTLTDALYGVISEKKSLPEHDFKKVMKEMKSYYGDFSEIIPGWYKRSRNKLLY